MRQNSSLCVYTRFVMWCAWKSLLVSKIEWLATKKVISLKIDILIYFSCLVAWWPDSCNVVTCNASIGMRWTFAERIRNHWAFARICANQHVEHFLGQLNIICIYLYVWVLACVFMFALCIEMFKIWFINEMFEKYLIDILSVRSFICQNIEDANKKMIILEIR